jgi:hypothetical protein
LSVVAGRARLALPDAHGGDVKLIEVNVKNVVHSYKGGDGNSAAGMHVISRTDWVCSEHTREPVGTACLAHSDVLLLLVLALALASWACFRLVAGTATSSVLFLFVAQAMFCMLLCPTLSIALRLAPSTFFAQYVRSSAASVLLLGIVGVMLTQTLFVFWYIF